jgi:lysine decarboxylase
LLATTIDLVASARERLRTIDGVVVLGDDRVQPTQLTVCAAGAGVNGNDIERGLIAAGMPIEYADRDTLAPMITIADTEHTVDRLVSTMIDLIDAHRSEPRSAQAAVSWSVRPEQVTSPREAFFAPHTTASTTDAIGRVSAELIAPYPPGVPVLAPGERITAEIVDALREAQAQGTRIAYAADPTLEHLRILA